MQTVAWICISHNGNMILRDKSQTKVRLSKGKVYRDPIDLQRLEGIGIPVAAVHHDMSDGY